MAAVKAFYTPTNSYDTTFAYTSNGLLQSVAYSYDAAERLMEITRKGSEAQNFAYAYNPENGQIASITNLESGLVTSYAYDLMDRTINISYRTSTGSLLRSLDYEYDAVGMISEKTDFNAATTSTVSMAYAYDTLDRLISESRTAGILPASSTQYSYDLAGNRLTKVSNGWKTESTLGVGNRLASIATTAETNSLYVSGSANETIGMDNRWGTLFITNLTSGASGVPSVNGASFFCELPAISETTNTIIAAIGDEAGNVGYATNSICVASSVGTNSTSSYEHDSAGNTTNLNGMALSWDERYRLTRVDEASNLVSYTYDVLGRRVSRTENSNTVTFVYNGQQVVADLDGSNNLLRTYTWGPGIDNLLCFTDHTISNTYYAIKDHQNTVLAFVDESGSVVESYEYDAWGNTKVFNASGGELTESAIGNRYTFQGREYDADTGLYYFRARWYNPETGRWLSKDPIGISGGLNLYAFCGNNPVNFIDPMGLDSYLDDVVDVVVNGDKDGDLLSGEVTIGGGGYKTSDGDYGTTRGFNIGGGPTISSSVPSSSTFRDTTNISLGIFSFSITRDKYTGDIIGLGAGLSAGLPLGMSRTHSRDCGGG